MSAKHTHRPNFGRKVEGCPRCEELAAGAEPIRWNRETRAEQEQRRAEEIRNHDCRRSGCGPICTNGDW